MPSSDREAPARPAPAGLDRRFHALAVDRALTWSLEAAAAVAAYRLLVAHGHPWLGVLAFMSAVALVGLGLALVLGLRGTSPGKAALGLRAVHHRTGAPIGAGPALLRTLVLALAGPPTFGLGLATLAWTAVADARGGRRGWHDRLTGSIVVDVRPPPAEVAEPDAAPPHPVNLTTMRLVPPPPVPAPTAPVPPVPAPTAPTPPAPAPPVAAPPRWRVSFDSGESLVLEGPALVGRSPEPRAGERVHHLVELASPDLSLSKTHAQLQVAPDGALVVTDRGSTNGSVLVRAGASRPLAPGAPATLLPGDLVCLGDRRMSVARET